MRARLSGKLGWLYGLILASGIMLLAVVLHYLVNRPLGWGDVLYAVVYSVGFTLLQRAFYRPRTQRSDPTDSHQDADQ
jgi:hypothetical protein